MVTFSPGPALVGGLLIGAGAVVLMLFNGRVMGVGGIFDCLLRGPTDRESPWRLAFLLGMMTPAAAALVLEPEALPVPAGLSLPLLVAGGFLVGFGSRMGNGCTSGHGVCGLARLSRRSLAATVTFFAVTAATVYVARHLVGN